MQNFSFKSLGAALALTVASAATAQEAEILASWTFENEPDVSATWFTAGAPHYAPEKGVLDAAACDLTAMSAGRYWQLTTGYNNKVLRIENAEPNAIVSYTNPEEHNVYYEAKFPTKGYENITVDFACAYGANAAAGMRIVVSADGGQSWFDAGEKTTAPTWWTYEPASVTLSAKNKDDVRVRVMAANGFASNWNLDYLTVTGTKMASAGPISAKGASVSWPFNAGKDNVTAAEVSVPEAVSATSFACGDNVFVNSVRTEKGVTMSSLKPVNNIGRGEAACLPENAVTFTIVPKRGVTFKPTGLKFNSCKIGTSGGTLFVDVTSAGKTVRVVEALDPLRNDYTASDVAISGIDATSEKVDVTFYVTNLANNKELGLGQIEVIGDFEGTPESVPSYTLKVELGTEGAGNVSCNPSGAEFDEGTEITVTATENFGYHFNSWQDADGKVVSEKNPYTFEIAANTVLRAMYEKNNVYALNLVLEGGANINQVTFTPEGNVVDGVHHYEEGTDVRLTTSNNRILAFTNWEDNSTSPERTIRMDGEKNLKAVFSAADYIVGWDFYFDQPNSERAADYKAESDNAGLLSLRNAEGKTSTWLTRGIGNGAENGKWGARIWRVRSDGYYFEASFSTLGYTNVVVTAALGISYNSYSVNNMQYSINGTDFTTVGTYNLQSGWTTEEFALPADASNQPRVWVRFMPDTTSDLVGNSSDYDGLCISDLFVLADLDAAADEVAPRLVNVIPADGSTGASSTGSIILTFDEKVKLGSGNATLGTETLTPALAGKSVVYNYSGLDYATSYTFTLPAGAITDRSGNAFEGVKVSFTTLERTQPAARLYDAVVAADGTGDYASVQAAIDAAPAGRVVPWLIFVKNGNYKEHVDIPASKPMIHIIGQDRDKTVILDDKLCGGDNALHVSVGATVVVNANDCMFENITLENSWGHEKQAGPQALALNTIGDRTVFNNVAMLSYQDTWITPSTSNYRAYVRNSLIEGAVDFIYNSGNIFIDNSTLLINRKSGGYIVAPSHNVDVEWGYVFNSCTITAPGVPSETTVWLGRPWHNYPKTVFLNTRAEVTIPATGWYETMGGLPALWADWNTVDGNGNPVDLSQRRDTYYRTEADGTRTYGKAKNFLTDEEAAQYTVKNVLSGSDAWQPVLKTEACAAPSPVVKGSMVEWEAVPYAICYVVTCDDKVVGMTVDTSLAVADSDAVYAVQAVNEFGGLSAKGTTISSKIEDIISSEADAEVVGIYDVQGRALRSDATGLVIVMKRYSDGAVRAHKELR